MGANNMSKKILILGINGFIGSNLSRNILKNTDWEIYGLDLASNNLTALLDNPRFHFTEGDMLIHQEWVEYHIKKCDVILPLVAIATPSTYVKDPLRVFELDFEANLDVVRQCVHYRKRLVFPSTSEVYGMSEEAEFNEETSPLVQGPINKERWIYSCSKQLMDRVIYAYGQHQGLCYTLFRPFNWIGPRQDSVFNVKEGDSRVVSQFIGNILIGKDIQLVNGGEQRRSFTYIDDGIEALVKIIENKNSCAEERIFNIGNPANDLSVKELAETVLAMIKTYPRFAERANQSKIITASPDDYYGKGYQDVATRVPSVENAKQHLGWTPSTDFKTAIKKTLDHYLLEPEYETQRTALFK